jgi:glycosyltransferase involved in cell wall biosynthesis
VPAHNEEEMLPGLLASLADLRARCGRPIRAILVDDASTDRTPEILATVDPGWVTCVRTERPLRQHRAVMLGVSEAVIIPGVWAILTMDADMDPPPGAVLELLPHLATHDLVVGGRTSRPRTVVRALVSAGHRALCNGLRASPIRDHGSMFRLFTHDVALRVLGLRRFGASLAAVSLLAAERPIEIPIPSTPIQRASRYGVGGVARVAADTAVLWMRVKVRELGCRSRNRTGR